MMNYTTEERSLAERLKPRLEIERYFERVGHTYRHGALDRFFERNVTRPLLRFGLKTAGLYEQGVRNALNVSTKRVRLEFPTLPATFDGFQILQISDFHIDGTDGLDEAIERALSGLEADLCVLTGDYRFEDYGDCEAVYPPMRRLVHSIRSRQGIYGILGNHDSGEIAHALEDLGVRMLVNEAAEIERGGEAVWLIGVDDSFDFRCDDLPAALAGVPRDAFKILLSHSPEIYAEASSEGIQLYLTGHTHAGQIRVPGIGAVKHNARCPRSMNYGLWRHRGTQGYTSAGVGCSGVPVRFNCPPEIVLIELARG